MFGPALSLASRRMQGGFLAVVAFWVRSLDLSLPVRTRT
jgi:hypothetical protein